MRFSLSSCDFWAVRCLSLFLVTCLMNPCLLTDSRLISLCTQRLARSLTKKNCVEYYLLAEDLRIRSLRLLATTLMKVKCSSRWASANLAKHVDLKFVKGWDGSKKAFKEEWARLVGHKVPEEDYLTLE